ncbi:MAG: hypothetical protein H7Y32_09835 [Chloroflexales bacterium]|nr:hypothetical protein [Chloroflexales bacterium]
MSIRPFALLALLALLLCAALAPALAPSARAASNRPVMAFYYPWWEQSDWSYDRMSDLPAMRYSSGDDDAMRRHLAQAAAAGIDGLICTWYGPSESRLDGRCRRLLDLADGSGVKVAVMPDQSAAFDPALRTVDGLAGALNTLQRDFMSKPAYLTFGGKPVVFWFNPPSLGGVGTWRALRDRADGGRQQFWFGGSDNFGYLDVFDALYYFDITWEGAPGAAMASYARRLSAYNAGGANKPFVATVMPGYDDLKYRNGHQRDRSDGSYYRGTWQTAIERNAAAVVLTSFNEFFEGSHIEPSERYGDLYLRLTRELSDNFRTQVSAAPAPATQQPGPCQTFPETGHTVCGRLLEYWQQNGGLPVFGFPITPQRVETIEGSSYEVQWFERNRLELHPENARRDDVLLGRLGADRLAQQARDWQSFPKVGGPPGEGCFFTGATGHAVCGGFLLYFRNHGLRLDAAAGYSEAESIALFGLPLSEPQIEVNAADGREYLTQWFERARFEYHPENAPPYDVLLGLLGREVTGIR